MTHLIYLKIFSQENIPRPRVSRAVKITMVVIDATTVTIHYHASMADNAFYQL
ncbi:MULTISPECIES: hypothetical protein [unclassified Acinetobacter]|uniref:hypothetical protein n=1 Tax=unclassified Acinetobacter TaxID=196816 RepID=UPI0035B90715